MKSKPNFFHSLPYFYTYPGNFGFKKKLIFIRTLVNEFNHPCLVSGHNSVSSDSTIVSKKNAYLTENWNR